MKVPMQLADSAHRQLPAEHVGLQWVGMTGVSLPLRIATAMYDINVHASIDVGVDLAAGVRGIHMSRIYALLQQSLATQIVAPHSLTAALQAMVESQMGIAQSASLTARFSWQRAQPALLTAGSGYKTYPILIRQTVGASQQLLMSVQVSYSSTCPCSAALSQQLLSEAFLAEFSGREVSTDEMAAWLRTDDGRVATPHAQRSTAELRVVLPPNLDVLPIDALIALAESALVTVTQTAVKREDEQAFARLNAQNTMFCEDAARRLHRALTQSGVASDFWIRVAHHESLHPHDAVAIVSSGQTALDTLV